MPSEKKKNPGLMEEIEDNYNVNYISPRNYMLTSKDCFNFRNKDAPSRK